MFNPEHFMCGPPVSKRSRMGNNRTPAGNVAGTRWQDRTSRRQLSGCRAGCTAGDPSTCSASHSTINSGTSGCAEPDAHVTATYAAEMHSRIHSRPQGWLKRWLLYWTEEWTRFSKKRRCKSTGLSKCKRNRTDVQLASQLPLAIQKAEHLAAKITTQRVTE